MPPFRLEFIMNKIMRVATFANFFAFVAMVFVLSGCGGGSGDATPTQLTVSQAALVMSVGESRTITVTSASALRATANPSTICSTIISGNTLTVTGVSDGKCEVLVSDGNGNITVTATVNGSVKKAQTFNIVPSDKIVEAGKTATITFTTPSSGLTTATSSDTFKCDISVTGEIITVKAKSVGSCIITATNNGDDVYEGTTVTVPIEVTPAGKVDQKALTLSTTKLSLESDIAAIYNSSDVSVYGGSGNGQLSAMTSDQNCTVVMTGTKDRHGGDIFTVTGVVPIGICTVTFIKVGDINYNTASVVLKVDIAKYRDKLAAAAAAYNGDTGVYHPSGLNNPATSIRGSDVVFHSLFGVYTGPENICILIIGSKGQEKGYFEIPYDNEAPEYGEAPQGSCDAATSYFRDKMLLMNL